MLSPLVSWILPSSSSSSSSEEQEEEESLDINTDESDYENDNVVDEDQKNNVQDDENDHYLSSCDVDDDNIPVALAVTDASPAVTVAFPATDDDRNSAAATAVATSIVGRSKRQRSSTKYSGGVRQYQRLWTKQDEMELLKGYLDYIKQQGRTTSLQSDVASLYDHVMPKLNVGFNRNQLVEKLRRLKRKHKVTLDKGKEVQVPFKSPQEQAIFEISHKIWGNDVDHDEALDDDESRPVPESCDLVEVKMEQVHNFDEIDKRVPKRLRFITDDVNTTNEQNNGHATTSIQGFIEDTMRSCLSPLLKELLDGAQEGPLGGSMVRPLCIGEVGDEEWKKRRIVELEVYLNRLELLQEQIKARLEELRSS